MVFTSVRRLIDHVFRTLYRGTTDFSAHDTPTNSFAGNILHRHVGVLLGQEFGGGAAEAALAPPIESMFRQQRL
jgi:hypothetical protein